MITLAEFQFLLSMEGSIQEVIAGCAEAQDRLRSYSTEVPEEKQTRLGGYLKAIDGVLGEARQEAKNLNADIERYGRRFPQPSNN